MDETAVQSALPWVGVAAVVGLAPFALISVTAYAKISIVLAFLRRALGLQQLPSNTVLAALAILLTTFIMGPVAADVAEIVQARSAQGPLPQEELAPVVADAWVPLGHWLDAQTGHEEREVFVALGDELYPQAHRDLVRADSPLVTLPAFLLTELKEAFIIGFLLFVPFMVVDLVVANVLMSLGMQSLSPATVSLPFKLLLFVMIDGWTLLLQGLVLGYA